jgi:hypothetical protein
MCLFDHQHNSNREERRGEEKEMGHKKLWNKNSDERGKGIPTFEDVTFGDIWRQCRIFLKESHKIFNIF